MTPLDNMDMGDAADQPPASEFNKDKFWYSEDTQELSVSDGSSWIILAVGGGPVPTLGIGARVDYAGTMRGTLDGDGTLQNMLVSPTTLDAVITNPYDYDLWVSGTLELGQYLVVAGVYTSRFALFSRALNAGPATVNMPAGSFTGGRDSDPNDATPTLDFPYNAGSIKFGFLLVANTVETLAVTSGLSLADDGTLDTYTIITQQLPSITYSGVPV